MLCSLIPSLFHLSVSSIFQPLRFFQIIFLYLIFLKSSNSKKTDLHSLFVLIVFLTLTSAFLSIGQIFDLGNFVYLVKPITTYTTGGWFVGSGQIGPFYLIIFTWIFYSDIYHGKKKNFLLILIVINILLSSSRTSLLILILIISYSLIKNFSIKKTIPFVIISFIYFLNIEILSPKLYRTFIDISNFNFKIDTFELRQINWTRISSYYLENCNILFGCGYNLIEEKSELLKTSYGVFTFDNMFLRLIVEGGVFALIIKLFYYFLLIIKTNLSYLIPLILMGTTQETIEDPIIFIPTLFLLFGNTNYDIQNT